MCFDGQATAADDYSGEAHLAQIISILGQFPTSLVERCEHGKQYFDENGSLCPNVSLPHPTGLTVVSFLGVLRADVHFPSRNLRELSAMAGALNGQDGEDFLAIIQSMLALEPRQRPEARELLSTAWIVGSDYIHEQRNSRVM